MKTGNLDFRIWGFGDLGFWEFGIGVLGFLDLGIWGFGILGFGDWDPGFGDLGFLGFLGFLGISGFGEGGVQNWEFGVPPPKVPKVPKVPKNGVSGKVPNLTKSGFRDPLLDPQNGNKPASGILNLISRTFNQSLIRRRPTGDLDPPLFWPTDPMEPPGPRFLVNLALLGPPPFRGTPTPSFEESG